jgi:uncharacterized membrane protein
MVHPGSRGGSLLRGAVPGDPLAAPSPATRSRRRPMRPGAIRVTVGSLVGVLVGLGLSFIHSGYTVWQPAVLLRWDAAVALVLLSIFFSLSKLSPSQTKENALRVDPSLPLSELLVLTAGVAVLAAVGLLLARAGSAHGGEKAYLIALGVASVALSWLPVHATFTLRDARTYSRAPEGGVECNEDDPPSYLDFAYLALTIGMTFQVSDTNLTTKAMRRVALIHSLLSYLFGAVIVALVINVVSSELH